MKWSPVLLNPGGSSYASARPEPRPPSGTQPGIHRQHNRHKYSNCTSSDSEVLSVSTTDTMPALVGVPFVISRRTFLGTAAAMSVAVRGLDVFAQAPSTNWVTSEYGKLRRVMVHPPGPETRKALPMMLGGHSMLTWELLRDEASDQHKQMVTLLRQQGAEVLFFQDLLDDAIVQARKQRRWRDWLSKQAPQLTAYADTLDASTLLGCNDDYVYTTDDSGYFRPVIDPLTTMFFTRDCAAMTPRGVVICNYNNKLRAFEATLARFIFQFASSLSQYPIAFDARDEQVYIQGGDILVVDDHTLMVGVGNSSTDQAASRLAQKLEMDVLAVQMPGGQWQTEAWDGLRNIFYHLDCLLNVVDRRKILAVPYLLESRFVASNPLLEVLEGFGRIDDTPRTATALRLADVRNVGWLRRYQAGSGQRDSTFPRTKVLDYLKEAGYEVVYVGGSRREEEDETRHLLESVLRESRFMATNVVATAPSQIVAYDGNPRTEKQLKLAGIEVRTFPASELVRANGGPHCLTLPLERSAT